MCHFFMVSNASLSPVLPVSNGHVEVTKLPFLFHPKLNTYFRFCSSISVKIISSSW